jgi:phage gp46-like protein
VSDISIAWSPALSRGDWVLNQASVTPTQLAVATPQLFGVGDGAAAQFRLVPGASQVSNLVAQIYRSDWQGNQLLYPTPRTNRFIQSAAFGTGWAAARVSSVTPAPAPDGSNNAQTITTDGTGSGTYYYQAISAVAGVPFTVRIRACAGSTNSFDIHSFTQVGNATFTLSGQGSVSSVNGICTGATIVPLSLPGWYECTATFLPTATGSNNMAPVRMGQANVSATFFAPQYEDAAVAGSYIPTGASAVTVTDYTLAANAVITLASAPAAGARLTWTGSYTLNVFNQGGGLATGNDLPSAVLLSLFTDRVAAPDDVIPDGTTDPRGWWGDDPAYPVGSRLWLLSRAKQTDETLVRAQGYIAEALQWLIDDGVVARFGITVEWSARSQLGARVVAYESSGGIIALNSSSLWAALATPAAPTPQGLHLTFFGS